MSFNIIFIQFWFFGNIEVLKLFLGYSAKLWLAYIFTATVGWLNTDTFNLF